MKKIIVYLLVFAILFLGCYQFGTPDATGIYAPYYILGANVPFADNLHTSQWDRVTLLEEDSYGRRYYAYTTPSIVLQCNIEVHVICQTESEDHQYGYYQDLCYIMRKADSDSFSDTQIAKLKAQNDWNSPMAAQKISYATHNANNVKSRSKSYLNHLILDFLGLSYSHSVITNDMEQISPNVQLCFVRIVAKNLNDLSEDRFFLVLYHTQPYSIITCEEVGFSWDYQETIQQFRSTWSSPDLPSGQGNTEEATKGQG